MAQINAYLSFAGNCREVMSFYQGCFGGDLDLKTFEEAPGDMMQGADKNQVMHAKLSSGELLLMGSDGMREAPVKGNMISLNINCNSLDEINSIFQKLSEGGNITMPLEDQFWGARFGMLTDKFGIHWMLNCEKPRA